MKPSKTFFCILCMFIGQAWAPAAERVMSLDLAQHASGGKADLTRVGDKEYEWSLPTGAAQTLDIDLKRLGVDVRQYDEIRFDLKPLVSQVGLNVKVFGLPEADQKSGWYLKFKTFLESSCL